MLCSIYHTTLKVLESEILADFVIYTQRRNVRHFITMPKYVIHWWFIDFNTWSYIT